MKIILKKYLSNKASSFETEKLLRWMKRKEAEMVLNSLILDELSDKTEKIDQDTQFQKEQVWENIKKQRNNTSSVLQKKNKPTSFTKKAFYYSSAACILAMSVLVWVSLDKEKVKDNSYITTITNAKERKNIILPDRSEVTLYENSSISYNKIWGKYDDRNVYLSGEGYFNIMHKSNSAEFIVHTSDSINVTVLGTKFEISTLNDKSRIILEEGKVFLAINKELLKMRQIMNPGDMVSVDLRSSLLENKKINVSLFTGRKNANFHLNHTSLGALADLVDHIYGYQIILPTNVKLSEEISGNLPNSSLSQVLDGISKLTDLKYIIEDKTVTYYE